MNRRHQPPKHVCLLTFAVYIMENSPWPKGHPYFVLLVAFSVQKYVFFFKTPRMTPNVFNLVVGGNVMHAVLFQNEKNTR